jgi:two-component system CheB/CheR fusion protein
VASDGPGRGARFSFWLPLADGSEAPSGVSDDSSPLVGLRMLLVDDTVDALDTFATVLRLEGADVTTASSARLALQAAERTAFDVVVSDVAMPEMDGYEFIDRLRRLPTNATVAAIALTGFGRPQDEQRALQAGFDAHLNKPTSVDTMARVVRQLRLAPRPGAPMSSS